MRFTTWITSALIAASLAACGSSKVSKDQCEKIVDHAADVAIKTLGAGVDEATKKEARDQMHAQMADKMQKCTEEVTQAQYDCVMKADTIDGIMKCGE